MTQISLKPFLHKGQRVRLSAVGRSHYIRRGKEHVLGTIATQRLFIFAVTYAVLWDGRKTPERLHEDFVEAVK